MIRKILYIAIVATAISGCQHNIDEALLNRSDISLTVKGKTEIVFNELTYQLGYSTAANEFRVYDETLTNWFTIRCSAMPTSEGQTVIADLEYTIDSKSKTLNGLEFTVEKTTPDGLLWLWNKDKQICVVVKTSF
jgi:hypothetical protein